MNAQLVLLATIMAMTTLQVSASSAPEVSMNILNCLDGESVPPGTCAVSNIKMIEARITLDRKGNTSLPPFSAAKINPGSTESPSHFVVVKAAQASTGTSVPIKALAYERTGEDGKEVVKITIEILEEPSVRQNKIQAVINQLKAQQATVPGAESQTLIDEATAKNAEILAAMEKLYSENRLGSYNLVVEYHSTQGSWIGQVTSPPVAIEVLNKGSFLDDLLQTP